MYFLIVAMLMLPGGAKDTTNFTAVPFKTMAECEMYLHNPNNKIMLRGSLQQYLKHKYGNMHVAITIEGYECRRDDELEWNTPKGTLEQDPAVLEIKIKP